MGCPFHDSDDDDDDQPELRGPDERGVDDSEFMKSALAIGGERALDVAVQRRGMPDGGTVEPIGIAERNNRQHGWDAFEADARGTTVPPPHHLLLLLDFKHNGEPSPGHRRQVQGALDQLEEAFAWRHDGLLFTVGYSTAYFDRFDEDLPYGLDPDRGQGLLRAEDTIEATALSREDPVADDYDAFIHLASDHVQNLLAAEAALWGDRHEINGVRFKHTLNGVFEKPDSYPERRTGFAGHGNLQENLSEDTNFDPDRIPEESDLSMGFNPLFANSVPRETNTSIVEDQKLVEPKPPGMFAQGSIAHVSKLDIDLDGWYDDHDLDGRRERMFSSHHSEDDVGVSGENLGTSNAPEDFPTRNSAFDDEDLAERTQADAEDGEPVGHVQKLARARFNLEDRLTDDAEGQVAEERPDDLRGHDGPQQEETVMLRRDIDSTDLDRPGMHFVALMRFNGYMNYMRQAMNGVEFDTATFGQDGEGRIDHEAVDVDEQDSGIVGYLDTQRRANFLLPPVTVRALPHPRAYDAQIDVSKEGDTYVVEIEDVEGHGKIDEDTVRFGHYVTVNRGGGATPSNVSRKRGTFTLEFPADETGFDGGTRARLFAKTQGSRRVVLGTAEL